MGTDADDSSQQRCLSANPVSAAECDQGELFVLTKNIPGVSGYTATPGWRASNEYFVEPPPLAGESCADALVLEAAGTIGDQNTEGYADDYNFSTNYSTLTGNCGVMADYDYDGPDGVFQIVAPQSMTSMTVVLDSEFDGALLVVGNCATMNSSCVGASDSEFDPGGGTESVTGPVTSGQTYFIIVDGFYPEAVGAYSVTVSFQ